MITLSGFWFFAIPLSCYTVGLLVGKFIWKD